MVQIAVVFLLVLKARVRSAVGKVVTWVTKPLTESFRPLPIVTGLIGDVLRSRQQELVAENMMLRQQLIVASRKVSKQCLRHDYRGVA